MDIQDSINNVWRSDEATDHQKIARLEKITAELIEEIGNLKNRLDAIERQHDYEWQSAKGDDL